MTAEGKHRVDFKSMSRVLLNAKIANIVQKNSVFSVRNLVIFALGKNHIQRAHSWQQLNTIQRRMIQIKALVILNCLLEIFSRLAKHYKKTPV